MGIEFLLNTEIGKDIQLSDLLNEYNVVFLGVGTYQATCGGLDNENASGIYKVLKFLLGNTYEFMGCVQTCIRQEVRRVFCACRCDEKICQGRRAVK
ncbi:Glutamate synthase [NADPH] small chain [Candidatus Steffania adelgidicola]|nr:Glutamate synthase [NADPH] small chain [Candidatus Steffania adelgidicola]